MQPTFHTPSLGSIGSFHFPVHEQFKKGEACLFFGGALLFYGVLKLRCWLALCLATLFSSTSELGSLSTLIPSLAAAFHSLPPSLKTQPSQLPQAIEGQSGAFKGTMTAAIILLSHGKSIFSTTVRVWEDLCSYIVPIPSSLLFMYD